MADTSVAHRRVDVDGVDTFYREAGPADAPVVLLPHGYPSSSFQFRGPKYAPLKRLWKESAGFERYLPHVTEDGFRGEFVGELPPELVARVSPDLWRLSWAQVGTPARREGLARLLADQPSTLAWFGRQQEYLRRHQPPAVIVWGVNDGYMPEAAARAYLRDLPEAELHLFDGGHWLLETHLDEVVTVLRRFLPRAYG